MRVVPAMHGTNGDVRGSGLAFRPPGLRCLAPRSMARGQASGGITSGFVEDLVKVPVAEGP